MAEGKSMIKTANKSNLVAMSFGHLPTALDRTFRAMVKNRVFVRYQPLSLGEIERTFRTKDMLLSAIRVAMDVNFIRKSAKEKKNIILNDVNNLYKLYTSQPLNSANSEFGNYVSKNAFRNIIGTKTMLDLLEQYYNIRIYVYLSSNSGRYVIPENLIAMEIM